MIFRRYRAQFATITGMNYLYHRVPQAKDGSSAMAGHTLYPLTDLKQLYPAIHERQKAKYDGRQHVMKLTIPLLGNCTWNSVIFMTSVHPKDLRQVFIEAGGNPNIQRSYYQIDPAQLEQDKLAVYLFKPNGGAPLTRDDFATYHYEDLAAYSQIPAVTKAYFKETLKNQGYIPLFYRFIPHILYQGLIDISKCEIITD